MIIRARRSLVAGGMCVIKGVTGETVVHARFRGRGLAPVGRECMKGWLVILLCHCVVQLVIKCSIVASIGAPRGATVDHVLKLAE